MSYFGLAPKKPHNVALRFEEVPEVSPYALPFLYGYIRSKVTEGYDFGAYVIRSVGVGAANAISTATTGQPIKATEWPFALEESTLHHDASPSAKAGLTYHYTEGGPILFLTLRATIKYFPNSPTAMNLYTDGSFACPDTTMMSPLCAQAVILNHGDLLAFNHRNPHAVSALVEDPEYLARSSWDTAVDFTGAGPGQAVYNPFDR